MARLKSVVIQDVGLGAVGGSLATTRWREDGRVTDVQSMHWFGSWGRRHDVLRGGRGDGADSSMSRLVAAPDEDGNTDPQTEADLDELHDALSDAPSDGVVTDAEYDRIDRAIEAVWDVSSTSDSSGSSCTTAVEESACLSPAQGHGRFCDIDTLDVEFVSNAYNIRVENGLQFNPVWGEMLELAWALLQDNVDIIEWIACLLTGENALHQRDFGGILLDLGLEIFTFGAGDFRTLGECLSEKIRNTTNDELTFKFEEGDPGESPFESIRVLSGGTVHIRVSHWMWSDEYVGRFEDAAAINAEERFCIIADFAATVLHEIVHSCMAGASADSDNPDTCELSYLMESCFRFMLGDRYPCLLTTNACYYYGDSRLWLDDGLNWPECPSWEECEE